MTIVVRERCGACSSALLHFHATGVRDSVFGCGDRAGQPQPNGRNTIGMPSIGIGIPAKSYFGT